MKYISIFATRSHYLQTLILQGLEGYGSKKYLHYRVKLFPRVHKTLGLRIYRHVASAQGFCESQFIVYQPFRSLITFSAVFFLLFFVTIAHKPLRHKGLKVMKDGSKFCCQRCFPEGFTTSSPIFT